MEITEARLREHIEPLLRVQRGNVRMPSLQVLNAILHVAENGCKWRRWPERYGPRHTIYMHMNRRSRKGVPDRVCTRLQERGLVRIQLEVVGLDRHDRAGPAGRHGGAQPNGPQAVGRARGSRATQLHPVAADARTAVAGDLVAGPGRVRPRLEALGPLADHDRWPEGLVPVMDRACEGDETRARAERWGFRVVVPPHPHRRQPRDHDRELHRRRNEVARLFRRVHIRYDQLDRMYRAFVLFALIVEALRVV